MQRKTNISFPQKDYQFHCKDRLLCRSLCTSFCLSLSKLLSFLSNSFSISHSFILYFQTQFSCIYVPLSQLVDSLSSCIFYSFKYPKYWHSVALYVLWKYTYLYQYKQHERQESWRNVNHSKQGPCDLTGMISFNN